jgi:hypothetical protein
MEINQPRSVKPKVRGHKLRSGLNWQEVLKQKGMQHTGIKQDLGVFQIEYIINVVGSTSDVEIKKTTNLETNLHGLAKFANYSVRVLAFTSAGEGVRSSPVHCTTEEDGESLTVILSVKVVQFSLLPEAHVCSGYLSLGTDDSASDFFLPEMVSTAGKRLLTTETQMIDSKLFMHVFVPYVCFFCSI